MDLAVIALTFAAIFVVELPDKTFIATLVLSTKYRPFLVWIGVGSAFLVQTAIAVAFGKAISLLPVALVQSIAGAMFLIGAIVLFREARGAHAAEAELEAQELAELEADAKLPAGSEVSTFRVIVTCFLVLFAAEWGDLSQILTVTLVAKYDEPISVFIGAWAALLTVAGLAALAGRTLMRYVRISLLQYIGGTVCLLLAVATAYELLG